MAGAVEQPPEQRANGTGVLLAIRHRRPVPVEGDDRERVVELG
jgi:hypothetical protein